MASYPVCVLCGATGEGAYKSVPGTGWYVSGFNLALAKAPVGQQLDMVSIMAYLAGGSIVA